jgi:hypothetical protein
LQAILTFILAKNFNPIAGAVGNLDGVVWRAKAKSAFFIGYQTITFRLVEVDKRPEEF